MTVSVVANGKPREIDDGITISDLLIEYGWRPEWVVVEYNGEPLERARYPNVRLRAGDKLEIVRAVAGG
ncbi:MAG TPA: sulfur carrier protein ThiS [Actinomycetota bacterium]|nr:sulfur carrier protein ThiS [Actinomycetota bacterium]